MRLPKLQHINPQSLDEALAALSEHGADAQVIAGGTDLLVQMKQRLREPGYVVNLKGLTELKGISNEAGKGLTIGGLVRLWEIIRSPEISNKYAILKEAARSVGAWQHQQMGTIGGNICLDTRCWYFNQSLSWRRSRPPCFKTGGDLCHVVKKKKECSASYSGDTLPALIALGARAEIVSSKGRRELALEDLQTGDGARPNILQPAEILTKIIVPEPGEQSGGVYLKLRIRESIDFPQLGVAVMMRLQGEDAADIRIVINAVGPAAIRITAAEDIIKNQGLTAAAIEAASEAVHSAVHPVKNMVGSVLYRRTMAQVFTRKAIEEAASRARGGEAL